METAIGTVFSLGTSTVLTIPKKFGLVHGTKVQIKKRGTGMTIRPMTGMNRENKRAAEIVRRLAGAVRGSFPLTPEQLNAQYEHGTYEQKHH